LYSVSVNIVTTDSCVHFVRSQYLFLIVVAGKVVSLHTPD
jgi:hypothetical protein